MQLLKKNAAERLGAGHDDGEPIKVSLLSLLYEHGQFKYMIAENHSIINADS